LIREKYKPTRRGESRRKLAEQSPTIFSRRPPRIAAFATAAARRASDRKRVQDRGRETGKRRWIGIARDLAALFRLLDLRAYARSRHAAGREGAVIYCLAGAPRVAR
jgi:hypothetical protein